MRNAIRTAIACQSTVIVEDVAEPIQVLADDVVNQIAAGEVIERPASVVKELVENSLDARARHITIDVSRGGKRLVRVLDDGAGMSRASIHLALQRHATSKLRQASDLFELRTLGFRGEALPSIASVSRMQITSRARGGDPGAWCVELEGGQVIAEAEVGAPPGTMIEVRDLLFNVPARQKFMKGDGTESAHISEWVARLALANPEVRFRLRHRRGSSSRITFDPAPGSRAERVEAVLGSGLRRAEGAGAGVKVEAFLAPPEQAGRGSRQVQLFVGRRPVRDRGLMHALLSGYGDALERGHYPAAALFVEVADSEVDVNVHPQKLEVRFADPQAIYAVVSGTVARAMAAARPRLDPATSPPPPLRRPPARGQVASRAAERLADYAASRRRFVPAAPRARAPVVPPRPPPATAEPDVRYLGQLDLSLLIAELDGDLMLIDQHAVSERVELARARRAHLAGSLEVQRLLFPEPLSVSAAPADVDAARLAGLGFEIERGAGGEVTLLSAPAGLRHGEPAAIASRLIDELAAGGGPRIEDTALLAIACNRALRAGEPIAGGEARRLIDAIAGELSGEAPRGPHGRALFVRIGADELARRFSG